MLPKEEFENSDLIAKMKDIEARAIEKSRQRHEQGLLLLSETESSSLAKIVKLPLWPDAVRAVPNGVLRSALFGAIRRGPRRYMKQERIAALEGIEIYYTGERLDQGDLDLWEVVLQIVRFQTLGNECRVTAYQILKALGKSDTGGNRGVLHSRMLRLKANGVEVQQGRFAYIGSLIDEVYRDKVTFEYVIRINPKLRTLYEPDQYTQVDWAVRRELDGQPLAQWLHGFYASHAKPYPISVAKLRELCGSDCERLNNFRRDLRKALDALIKASTKHEQSFSYVIHNDVIHVDKEPSKAQRKHLENKIKK